MDKIIWKPVIIKDVKPIYEVSNYGDIRNIKTGKLRKPSKDKEGYLNINLSAISKKYKGFGVHRIVAKTFIPNPNNLETVNHINYDKTDNRVCNLNWMSNYDNIQDAKIHGRFLHRKGEDAPNSKYTELQINSVCKLLEEGFQNKDISKITGVPKNIIGFIKMVQFGRIFLKIIPFRNQKKNANTKNGLRSLINLSSKEKNGNM